MKRWHDSSFVAQWNGKKKKKEKGNRFQCWQEMVWIVLVCDEEEEELKHNGEFVKLIAFLLPFTL